MKVSVAAVEISMPRWSLLAYLSRLIVFIIQPAIAHHDPAANNRHRRGTLRRRPLERAEVVLAVQVGRADQALSLEVDDRDIGVAPDLEATFAGKHGPC